MYEAVSPAKYKVWFTSNEWYDHFVVGDPAGYDTYEDAEIWIQSRKYQRDQYTIKQGSVILTKPPLDGTFVTKADDKRETLAGGMVRSPTGDKTLYHLVTRGPMLRRWAELLTRGAKVYGADNWMMALTDTDASKRKVTKDRFIESAFRHFMQFMDGDRTEDHAAAVIFNLNGYEAMLATDRNEAKDANAAK